MTLAIRAARLKLATVGLVLLAAGSAWGQLRVATWNVSNYTGGRVADIQTSVYALYESRSFSPDIILGQEFFGQNAVNQFRDALNTAAGSPGDWDAVYVDGDGGSEGNVLFYRTSRVNYLSNWVASPSSLPAGPRKVICYKVRLQGYTTNRANLYCYNSHMKAGNGGDDKARRLAEAENIRDNAETVINPAYHFLLGADLNMYTSSEAAYQELTGSQPNNDGRFFDPINTPGYWHDNSYYRFVHTQDPATTYGMDDRYDQMLVSQTLVDGEGFEYIGNPAIPYSTTTWDDPNHSRRCWGNDGTSFNQPLTTTGNTMVGEAIAQALKDLATTAGGHLPVYLDLRVPARIGADESLYFGQVEQGASAEELLAVWNAGDVTLWGVSGLADLSYSFSASTGFTAPDGTYVSSPGGPTEHYTITMDTSTPGVKTGTLTINATGADETSRVLQLTGEVLAPTECPGDCNCDSAVNWRDIDFFVAGMNNNQLGWEAMFLPGEPTCPYANCDVSGDGFVNWRDIDPLVELMNTTCP
ncbi:MAG: hypothetical protein KAY37_14200 [Phycisphaerae bacterium]|nr:hypothetical protein [Phycisphaerae bacterium]